MAKIFDKILDNATRNAITEQINIYIDSIKEDIGYDEFDKSLQTDAVIEQIIDYYVANPMDDTMSYDDWVNDFIDGKNLRNNAYKSQFKDYLRNLVMIIYSNLSEVEYRLRVVFYIAVARGKSELYVLVNGNALDNFHCKTVFVAKIL